MVLCCSCWAFCLLARASAVGADGGLRALLPALLCAAVLLVGCTWLLRAPSIAASWLALLLGGEAAQPMSAAALDCCSTTPTRRGTLR